MARGKALGRGLEALIPSAERPAETLQKELPVESLRPNPLQPRQRMDASELQSLADSVREHGIVQPIIVRAAKDGYEIIAGERRWRAAKMAGLSSVPVQVIDASDSAALEIALVENLQREDLSPLEVARALKDLIERFHLTHEEVASRLGWSRSVVTNKLRLLDLPERVRNLLLEEKISEGHARLLLSLESADEQVLLAEACAERGLSVRDLEQAIQRRRAPKKTAPQFSIPEAENLCDRYGIRLKLIGRGKRKRLVIEGFDEEQVRLLVELMESAAPRLFPRK